MKSAPDALIALLNSSQQFSMADIYQITLISGVVLRYTDYDADVVDGADTYAANSILINRSRVRLVLGVEVDTLDITVNPHPADMVGSATFLKTCAAGLLDGAFLLMKRMFFDEDGLSIGGFVNFSGRIADMQMTRSEVNITVKSDLELLNVKLPRNLYQAQCINTLYDVNCGLNRADWGVLGTVTSATKTTLSCGISKPATYYDLGYIQFETGALAGTRRTVKSYESGNFTLLNPLPFIPTVGDTFTAYAGCDKSQATCGAPLATAQTFTADATTDTLTAAKHGYISGNAVRLTNTGGALPTPLIAGLDYYVINPAINSYQLALTIGGTAINITTTGTGASNARLTGKFNNIVNFRGFPYIPVPETTR